MGQQEASPRSMRHLLQVASCRVFVCCKERPLHWSPKSHQTTLAKPQWTGCLVSQRDGHLDSSTTNGGMMQQVSLLGVHLAWEGLAAQSLLVAHAQMVMQWA